MAGDEYGFNPRLTPRKEEQVMGAGILLPPSDEYNLKLRYMQKVEDGTGEEKVIRYTSSHSIRLEGGFKAGNKYEVVIKVYGLRRVVLQLGDVLWEDGGDIDIDEDGAADE